MLKLDRKYSENKHSKNNGEPNMKKFKNSKVTKANKNIFSWLILFVFIMVVLIIFSRTLIDTLIMTNILGWGLVVYLAFKKKLFS